MKIILFLLLSISLISFSRATEKTKIAVIDGGVDASIDQKYICADSKDFTNSSLFDSDGHGSNVAGLISMHMNPDKECLLILKTFTGGWGDVDKQIEAILYAVKHKAKFINMSYSGTSYFIRERLAIYVALMNGIQITVAAGNEEVDLGKDCQTYPACYVKDNSNFRVAENWVGNIRVPSSNFNFPRAFKEDGFNQCFRNNCKTGTSQSAAILTGKLVESQRR